jgi:hypothetical protein
MKSKTTCSEYAPAGTLGKEWGPVIYLGRPYPPPGHANDWTRGEKFTSASTDAAAKAIEAKPFAPRPLADDQENDGEEWWDK